MSANSQENAVKDSCASLNTPAPVIFVQSLQHQVNEHDIHSIIQSQKHMLARFEKTNEMLVNCNALLASRHVGASKELKKHISFLIELKKDLETIFRRIRFLKMKLSQQYGEAFHVAANSVLDEEEEQEEKPTKSLNDSNIASAANASSSGSRESSPCSFTSPSTSDTG